MLTQRDSHTHWGLKFNVFRLTWTCLFPCWHPSTRWVMPLIMTRDAQQPGPGGGRSGGRGRERKAWWSKGVKGGDGRKEEGGGTSLCLGPLWQLENTHTHTQWRNVKKPIISPPERGYMCTSSLLIHKPVHLPWSTLDLSGAAFKWSNFSFCSQTKENTLERS